MGKRILEGAATSVIAAIFLAVIARALGLADFSLDTSVLLLAFAVAVSLLLGLRIRGRLKKLQNQLAEIPYEQYFPDETSAYPELRQQLKTVPRLRLVSLANTSVFTLFEEYAEFLSSRHSIEILCLDPSEEEVLSGIDQLVSIAAAKQVLPRLIEQLVSLDVPATVREKLSKLLSEQDPASATRVMIQASLVLWKALAEKAESTVVDSSRFLQIRLYRSPPTIKGWILGDEAVLRGDFSIPGYGLTEPVMFFTGARSRREIDNFLYTFQLLWTDDHTRVFMGGSTSSARVESGTISRHYSALLGSFYETEGRPAAAAGLACLERQGSKTVIDLCAGTGYFSLEIARKMGSSATVVSVDVNRSLTAGLRHQLQSLRWPPRGCASIEVVNNQAMTLELPDESTDAVWFRHAIHHLKDPAAAFDEIWRVLAFGGLLVLIDVVAPEDEAMSAFLNRFARRVNPDHVEYLSEGELERFLRTRRFSINHQSRFKSYSTPLSDYLRRCSPKTDLERLQEAAALLRECSVYFREEFEVQGGDIANMTLVLPELLICAVKDPEAVPTNKVVSD